MAGLKDLLIQRKLATHPLFANLPASSWIPDSFPIAQGTAILQKGVVGGQPYRQGMTVNIDGQPVSIIGKDWRSNNEVAAHELGHVIHDLGDMDQLHQNAWTLLHNLLLRRTTAETRPDFLYRYPDSPSHSFAEAFGQYAANPEQLQKESPEAYDFIRRIAGFEYSRKKP